MERNTFSKKQTSLLLVIAGSLVGALPSQSVMGGQLNLEKAMARSVTARTPHATRAQPVCKTTTVADTGDAYLNECQKMTVDSQELCQPKEFDLRGKTLENALDVRLEWQCVPFFGKDPNEPGDDKEKIAKWFWTVKRLRNYGHNKADTPVDPNDPDFREFSYNFPGPTFRMRRNSLSDAVSTYQFPGDKFQMWLYNNMGATAQNTDHTCLGNDAQPIMADSRWAADKNNSPNCFHGLNTTNFHFHGFHISPQFHQDYVLLELYPKGTIKEDAPDYKTLSEDERKTTTLSKITGGYYYDLDPLPHNQAEGTHWFHAHKHGSTSTQLMNGLSGTFLIEGPLDYWLNDYFGHDAQGDPILHDELMVIQQINDTLTTTPRPLINGQAVPLLTMNVGETQRWRFVAATMNANAELTIAFGPPDCLTVKQIAMDGVQFGHDNYKIQPLLKNGSMKLFAGNRADFLVQVPNPLPTKCVSSEGLMHLTYKRNDKIKAETTTPVLVEGKLFGLNILPQAVTMKSPPPDADWPKLPGFLTLDPNAGNENREEMLYTQKGKNGGDVAPEFYINDTQFTASCVPPEFTVEVGSKAKWTVVNKKFQDGTGPYTGDQTAHPFHIHTNPFLVWRNGKDCYEFPIWQDVIGLPSGTNKFESSVKLQMTFDDYTGSYVNHCHILGHEDRGMMTLVQSVCPNSPDAKHPSYGTPIPNQADNCAQQLPGEYTCPAPKGYIPKHH